MGGKNEDDGICCGQSGDGCGICCGQSGCGICCGQKTLVLSPLEYDILLQFAEIPFFPVAFAVGSLEPVSRDFEKISDGYGAALSGLQKKSLLSIDADIRLPVLTTRNIPLIRSMGAWRLPGMVGRC